MPSIEFMDCTGDEIKSTELDLEKSTPEELKKALIEHLSPKAKTSDQPNWFKDGNLAKYYEVE